jgi:CDP-glycerol glycerophosphotransferase (TagB/SpsB family)
MTFTNINRIITLPLYFLLSLISIIFPKDKRLWVFGAWYGQRYSDNSRYLFEYVYRNESEVRAVWLTRNNEIFKEIKRNGKEVYYTRSLKGFWMALRASVAFVSSGMIDVNSVACYGALKVQLWHGIPLKKIEFDDKISGIPDRRKLSNRLKYLWRKIFYHYDLVVSSSPTVSERLASAFEIGMEQILLTGYPRSDVILGGNPPPICIFEELRKKWNAEKMIFYAPTFRRQDNGGVELFRGMDFQKLQKCLVSHKAAFFIKLHYVQREQTLLCNDETNLYRVHLLSEAEAPDINYILPRTDILITDYSSVYFDYLLLNRPIIFTPFDIQNYKAVDREFYEDYDHATPGGKCKDWDEVVDAIDDVFNGNDLYQQSRIEKRGIYYSYVDTGNCERIIKDIKVRILQNRK